MMAFFPTIDQMLGPLLYLRLMCGGAMLFCYASAGVDGLLGDVGRGLDPPRAQSCPGWRGQRAAPAHVRGVWSRGARELAPHRRVGGAEPIWTVRMEILEGLGLDRLRQCCDCTMCINFGGAYRRY